VTTSTVRRVPPDRDAALPLSGVQRTRVLQVLDQHRDVPVVSLEAPGGYGKTTLLRQWVARDARPCLWITVRPQAPDASWLARSVVDGLIDQGLLSAPVTLPNAVEPVAWHLSLLPVVEQALDSLTSPFVLVVDEAGALAGPEWESLAASVAGHLPAGAQLVLAGRTPAPSSLRHRRASGGFVSLGPEVLALDVLEGAALARSLGRELPEDELVRLLDETGGWPIALPLAVSALHAGRRPATPFTTQELRDYLRCEVLDGLSPHDGRFLLLTSVLPELDETMCDAVAGTDGSVARLRTLAMSTRLLAPVDEGATRFRVHPLLASFLDDELHATEPAVWRGAHVSAAAVAERRGDLDLAVYHLQSAQDDARLATLVWDHSAHLLANGRSATLRRWLEGIDDARLAAQPRLALTAAWVASHEGDMIRMERLLLSARHAARRTGGDVLLDVELLEATVGVDGLEAIRSASRRFIAARGEGDPWVTLAHLLDGIATSLLGDSASARATLERGYHQSVVHQVPFMTVHCLAALADLALLEGAPERAVAAMREARPLMLASRMDAVPTSAPVFTTSAFVYLLGGRAGEARAEATRALRMTALIRPMAPWHAVQGRLALASLSLGLGDMGRARELLAEAEAASGPATRSPVLARLCDELRARIQDTAGEGPPGAALTTAEVRVLQYLPTHLSFPEIAAQLFVSRHTVKTQALSAYRKLGAHTRGEAITKARAIGLLPPV
jgi:LuxR family maltose regulon positive regulatory protein